MNKEELHKIMKRGVKSEIVVAYMQYLREVNFYKRQESFKPIQTQVHFAT